MSIHSFLRAEWPAAHGDLRGEYPSTTSLADVGLLIPPVGVGATMMQAGPRKAFDFNTTVGFMESGGRLPEFAASRRPAPSHKVA